MAAILCRELETRWTELYRALAAGEDLPPGRRLRAEGIMEAAVLLGEATPQQLQEAMDRVHLEVCGRSLQAQFGEDWREFYPFPQIPGVMRRAPVWPSTRD